MLLNNSHLLSGWRTILTSAEVNVWREKGWIPIANHISDIVSCASAVKAHHTFIALAFGEHVPETKSLISGSGYYRSAIRAHCKVQNAESMASKGTYFLHWWILPDNYLVKRVTVSTNNFICGPREHQVAYLGPSINAVYVLKIKRVPEPYALIGSTSTSRK